MNDTVKFCDFCRKILDIKKNDGLTDNGFYTHWFCPIEKHLIPFFGECLLTEITYTMIAEYFVSKRDFSKATQKIHLAALNNILEYACYDDIIRKNPCTYYRLKPDKFEKEKDHYTEEQAEMILRYCYIHRFGLDVFIMLKTGISRAELLGITWDDISLDEKLIYINKDVIANYKDGKVTKAIGPTKNRFRKRYVAIDDETVEFLKMTNRKMSVDDMVIECSFLVHNKFGEMCNPRTWSRRHYDVFMRDMQQFYSERGQYIPHYTPHSLRHTRATLYLNQGCPPTAIITQMGWSDTSMLDRIYGHRDIRELRDQLGL